MISVDTDETVESNVIRWHRGNLDCIRDMKQPIDIKGWILSGNLCWDEKKSRTRDARCHLTPDRIDVFPAWQVDGPPLISPDIESGSCHLIYLAVLLNFCKTTQIAHRVNIKWPQRASRKKPGHSQCRNTNLVTRILWVPTNMNFDQYYSLK